MNFLYYLSLNQCNIKYFNQGGTQSDISGREHPTKCRHRDIYGTVTLPEIYTEVPVVLIIAGSGPTDRDGNNIHGLLTDSYKMIAYELAQNGIASVRYDKRGIGESSKAMKSEEE